MTKLPFYRLSSYNRRGGKKHPIVARRYNQVMDLWSELTTAEDIAKSLDISPDTVRKYVRRARRAHDPRAIRPQGIDRRALQAKLRHNNIVKLAETGMRPHEIAKRLGVHVRLVQRRLKEARQ